MLIKMQVFDLRLKTMFVLRSKSTRFSSECSLGIKVHSCDLNMPHVVAVTLMNN